MLKNVILIVLICGIVYANSLSNSFVVDDPLVIVHNQLIKSWKNLPLIFSQEYLTSPNDIKLLGLCKIGSGETSYRPVVTLSYFVDYSLWDLNPFGYHLTNITLHILNASFLYLLLGLIFGSRRIALLGSLLFAVHPVTTEAVNVISFREDLLSCLFFLLSFILFIKYYQNRRFLLYLGSVLSFLFASFSKEMALSFPLILILYCRFFFGKKFKAILYELKFPFLGYIIIGAFYFSVRFLIFPGATRIFPYPGGNFYLNILTMSNVIATYIKSLFFPTNLLTLSLIGKFPPACSLFEPRILLSITLISISLISAFIVYKFAKGMSFGILWFFIALLPVSNIIPIENIFAYRYLYIPSIGFCIFLGTLFMKSLSFRLKALKGLGLGLFITVVVLFSVLTISQNRFWKDNLILWTELSKKYPEEYLTHLNLSACLYDRGLLDEAIEEVRRAIELNPRGSQLYRALGLCYSKKGEFLEAEKNFLESLNIDPHNFMAYNDLGTLYGSIGSYNKSIENLKKSIELAPHYVLAYNNLATTYAKMEEWGKAKEAWEKALRINPNYKSARDNLARLKASKLH